MAARDLVASMQAALEARALCCMPASFSERVDVRILAANYGYVLLFLFALVPAGARPLPPFLSLALSAFALFVLTRVPVFRVRNFRTLYVFPLYVSPQKQVCHMLLALLY